MAKKITECVPTGTSRGSSHSSYFLFVSCSSGSRFGNSLEMSSRREMFSTVCATRTVLARATSSTCVLVDSVRGTIRTATSRTNVASVDLLGWRAVAHPAASARSLVTDVLASVVNLAKSCTTTVAAVVSQSCVSACACRLARDAL